MATLRNAQKVQNEITLVRSKSSPGCASYGLKYMASQKKEGRPSAAQFIMHDLYVDDRLTSVESAQQAKDLMERAREICEKGGARLHKFAGFKRLSSSRISTKE